MSGRENAARLFAMCIDAHKAGEPHVRFSAPADWGEPRDFPVIGVEPDPASPGSCVYIVDAQNGCRWFKRYGYEPIWPEAEAAEAAALQRIRDSYPHVVRTPLRLQNPEPTGPNVTPPYWLRRSGNKHFGRIPNAREGYADWCFAYEDDAAQFRAFIAPVLEGKP